MGKHRSVQPRWPTRLVWFWGYLKLWEVSSGRVILTFEGHSKWVSAVAFSPDGQLALSGSGDKTLKLWNVSSGRVIRTFKGHSKKVN